MYDQVKPKGDVEIIVNHRDGHSNKIEFPNQVLKTGRRALALSLANQFTGTYSFYITKMLFGDDGTLDGVKKYVNSDRDGLFGTTRISKSVIASIDPVITTQVIFTAVLNFDEGVGLTLNEMALQMKDGNLYSMSTFADLNKTDEIQLVVNWKMNLI